jgi:hypothetical protein
MKPKSSRCTLVLLALAACSESGSQPHIGSTTSAVTIYGCMDISQPGDYYLGGDLYGSGICLSIHDTSNVRVFCQGHTITNEVSVRNVNTFTLDSCHVQAQSTSFYAFDINNSTGMTFSNNVITGGVNVANLTSSSVTGNQFTRGYYQQNYSSYISITGNTMTGDGSVLYPAMIISNTGNHNTISNNYIDGAWSGNPADFNQRASDDGIATTDEDSDRVENNTILNNWDCAFEASGYLTNSVVNNNTIRSALTGAVCAWYWASWTGNTVTNNTADSAGQLFTLYRIYGLRAQDQNLYFLNNTFRNNKLNSFLYASNNSARIDFQNVPVPAQNVIVGNNVFSGNYFNPGMPYPNLIPTSMFVDGGGNTCPTSEPPGFPLACGGAAPNYQGYQDYTNCTAVGGWAWDANQPNTPINVTIYDGGTALATITANQYRQDLVNAGIGNGYHGFTYNFSTLTGTHSIKVMPASSSFTLVGGPASITCGTPPPQITAEQLAVSPYSSNTAYLNNWISIWGNNFCSNPQVYLTGYGYTYAYLAGTYQINAYVYGNAPTGGQYVYVICNNQWSNAWYVNVTNPVQSVSCSLGGPGDMTVGNYGYWSGNSNPTGYASYWYGTKNGNWDVYGGYAGSTNWGFWAYYDASTVGYYTRYLQILDASGNTVCTTNTVYTNVHY